MKPFSRFGFALSSPSSLTAVLFAPLIMLAFSAASVRGDDPDHETPQRKAAQQKAQQKAVGGDSDEQSAERRSDRPQTADDNRSDDEASMEKSMEDRESPALGVMVGACPGEGVCVLGSLWGSPAQRAGIRAGDYILAFNDQPVESPEELRQLVRQHDAGSEARLKVWRKGDVFEESVTLAAEATEPPDSHRAWLGVMLRSPEEGEGIVIERVHPGSPAEDAGLRSGDRIVQLAEEEISSIEDFIDDVRDYGPGSELKLTISRDGKEQLLSVVLGKVEEAPLRWMRFAFRNPIDELQRELESRERPGVGVMDEVVDDLRRQMRQLQRQMDELTGRPEPARSADEDAGPSDRATEQPDELRESGEASRRSQRRKDRQERQERRRREAKPDDNAAIDRTGATAPGVTLVVQRPNRESRQGNRQVDRRFGKYGNPDFYDRLREQRYRGRYGNPRYGSFYRYPGYRAPYRNRYYRYGGQPYFYGGRSIYGPRFGVRIGPRLGLYWY